MTDQLEKDRLMLYWGKLLNSPLSYTLYKNDAYDGGYKLYISHKICMHIYPEGIVGMEKFYIQVRYIRAEISQEEYWTLITLFKNRFNNFTENTFDEINKILTS